ncbi:MAG: type II secretion system protein [Oscillospiraceae bacterium]
MHQDNRGFTLIELLIVITIMGILAAVIGISLSVVGSARAKSCATKLNTYISQCRTSCLCRAGNVYSVITRDSDGNLIAVYYEGSDSSTPKSTTLLSGKGPLATYYLGSAETGTQIDSAHPLTLAFDSGTGALKKAPGESDPCTKIEITSENGRRTFTITLVPSTGAHEMH